MQGILLLSVFMIFLWGLTGITEILYLITAVLGWGMLFTDQKRRIIYLYALVPWSIIMTTHFYIILSVWYCILSLINLIKKDNRLDFKLVFGAILFIISALISFSFEGTDPIGAQLVLFYFSVFLAAILSIKEKIDVELTAIIFSFSIFLTCIGGLLVNYFPYFGRIEVIDITEAIQMQSFARFIGLDNDPNFFSFNVMMAITFIGLLFSYETKQFTKRLYLLLIIILSIFGFLSLSSTYAFVWLIYMICFTMLANNGKINIKYPLALIIVGGIIMLLFPSILDFLNSGYDSRFDRAYSRAQSENFLSGFTSGRSDIWFFYLSQWLETPLSFLFGMGVMAREEVTAHNTLIRFIYMFGFVGTLSFIFTIYRFTKKVKMDLSLKTSLINYLPILIFIIFTTMLDMFRGNSIMFFIPYIILLIYIKNYTGSSFNPKIKKT